MMEYSVLLKGTHVVSCVAGSQFLIVSPFGLFLVFPFIVVVVVYLKRDRK